MTSANKIAIVGGSGYTGQELLRLLANHPQVEIVAVCSRTHANRRVDSVFPFLRGIYSLTFSDVCAATLAQSDLVFFATPHAVAMHYTPALRKAGIRVIDLSADFRIKDPALWKRWYGMDHACPELLSEAIYGLPELTEHSAIAGAGLIANPGCYATAMQLALAPVMDLTDTVDIRQIIVDGKSGLSGAGKTPQESSLLAHASENFSAYKVTGHRHHAETCAQLAQRTHRDFSLTFVPHIVPMVRGILTTCYLPCLDTTFDFVKHYEHFYRGQAYIDILPDGSPLETKSVAGTNLCRISPQLQDTTLVTVSLIDNLIKGAAGQAVQNMNIMLSLDQQTGLSRLAHYP